MQCVCVCVRVPVVTLLLLLHVILLLLWPFDVVDENGLFYTEWHLPQQTSTSTIYTTLCILYGHRAWFQTTRFVLLWGHASKIKQQSFWHRHIHSTHKHLLHKCAQQETYQPVWPNRLSVYRTHTHLHTKHAKSNLFVIFHFYYNKFYSNTIKSIQEWTKQKKIECCSCKRL